MKDLSFLSLLSHRQHFLSQRFLFVCFSLRPWDELLTSGSNFWLLYYCLLHINCYFPRTDCKRTGAFPISIQPRWEIWVNLLHKSVTECVYCCKVLSVDKNDLPFVIVQFYSNPLGFLFQHQLDARRGLSPEGVPVAQADHPETLRRVEEDCVLSLDGLCSYSDVPLLALAHVHSPAVLPRCETSGSQHTHAASASFGIVG